MCAVLRSRRVWVNCADTEWQRVEFATDEFLSEYYHFRTHLLRPSAKKLRRPPKTGFALTTVLLLAIGDAAEIRTKRVRKQKTDRQDAQCNDWASRSLMVREFE
jgi:hypothetical protein